MLSLAATTVVEVPHPVPAPVQMLLKKNGGDFAGILSAAAVESGLQVRITSVASQVDETGAEPAAPVARVVVELLHGRRALDFDFHASEMLVQGAEGAGGSPLLELETARNKDGRGTMRIRAARGDTDTWQDVPHGLALAWVVGLGVYRAEQRNGLVHAFLSAPPRPDMRRLRLLPDTASVDDKSAWRLLPWGPSNPASSELDLKEVLPLALPLYASLINFKATADLLGRCADGHVLSGHYGHAYRHGRSLLGACVATIDIQPDDEDSLSKRPAGSAKSARKKPAHHDPGTAISIPLTGAAAECSLDLTRPLPCPAPGGGHVCVSTYIVRTRRTTASVL